MSFCFENGTLKKRTRKDMSSAIGYYSNACANGKVQAHRLYSPRLGCHQWPFPCYENLLKHKLQKAQWSPPVVGNLSSPSDDHSPVTPRPNPRPNRSNEKDNEKRKQIEQMDTSLPPSPSPNARTWEKSAFLQLYLQAAHEILWPYGGIDPADFLLNNVAVAKKLCRVQVIGSMIAIRK